jgi:hypothetical protein
MTALPVRLSAVRQAVGQPPPPRVIVHPPLTVTTGRLHIAKYRCQIVPDTGAVIRSVLASLATMPLPAIAAVET